MHGVVEIGRVVAELVVGVVEVREPVIVGKACEHVVHTRGVRHLARPTDVERRGDQHHRDAVATALVKEHPELPHNGCILMVGNLGLFTQTAPVPLPVMSSETFVQQVVGLM